MVCKSQLSRVVVAKPAGKVLYLFFVLQPSLFSGIFNIGLPDRTHRNLADTLNHLPGKEACCCNHTVISRVPAYLRSNPGL